MSRRMASGTNTLQIVWTGPYGWPGYSAELPLLPQHPGVYLRQSNTVMASSFTLLDSPAAHLPLASLSILGSI